MQNRPVPLFFSLLGFISLVFCSCRAPEPGVTTVTILENAVRGGKNSRYVEWYDEVLPGIEKKLGIKVKLLTAGIMDEDFKVRIALDIKSKKGADIIGLDQFWIPEFADAGLITPLDAYLETWPGVKHLYDSMRRMGSYKGHTYLIMRDTDVRMLFYHKPCFRAAGIRLPWQPGNWEEIIDAARKIKASRPGVIPLQINAGLKMGEATAMQGFLMLLFGAGGELYDEEKGKWVVESAALRRTLEFYRRIYVKENLADVELQLAGHAREKSFELFQKGGIACYIEGTWFYTSVLKPESSWGIRDRDERIGWAKMPGSGDKKAPGFVSVSGGSGLIINPSSPHPELAWKVISELNSSGNMARLFSLVPFSPTRKDIARLPVVQSNKFISKSGEALVPVTRSRPGISEYPEVSFQVQLMTEEVITGKKTVEEAIKDFGKSIALIAGKNKVIRR
ncbi:MAG: extracellular solute-binding protein [Elusimicrobia bacterium]|nr:extracellular solute-binding protein [Elusimicrobiota bacterium]